MSLRRLCATLCDNDSLLQQGLRRRIAGANITPFSWNSEYTCPVLYCHPLRLFWSSFLFRANARENAYTFDDDLLITSHTHGGLLYSFRVTRSCSCICGFFARTCFNVHLLLRSLTSTKTRTFETPHGTQCRGPQQLQENATELFRGLKSKSSRSDPEHRYFVGHFAI